jgi:hypothetical protein
VKVNGGAAVSFVVDTGASINPSIARSPVRRASMVDTGASQFVDLNRPFVEAHRLGDLLSDATSVDRPAALGGSAPFLHATAKRVTLGSLVFEWPRIGLSRAQTGSSSRRDRDGIIGNALLQQFVMTVDYKRHTIILER